MSPTSFLLLALRTCQNSLYTLDGEICFIGKTFRKGCILNPSIQQSDQRLEGKLYCIPYVFHIVYQQLHFPIYMKNIKYYIHTNMHVCARTYRMYVLHASFLLIVCSVISKIVQSLLQYHFHKLFPPISLGNNKIVLHSVCNIV